MGGTWGHLLFDAIKKHGLDWDSYERRFLEILRARKIEETVSRDVLDGACLLCTEETPDHCHRRLVAEYLRVRWLPGVVDITHIVRDQAPPICLIPLICQVSAMFYRATRYHEHTNAQI